MNQASLSMNRYINDPRILTQFQSIKQDHKEFPQSLELKTIKKGSKISKFMQSTQTSNTIKNQIVSFESQTKVKESYPKKNNQFYTKTPISKCHHAALCLKSMAFSSSIQKLQRIKSQILGKKFLNHSFQLNSIGNQRSLAYDLDISYSDANVEDLNISKTHDNIKHLQQTAIEQKKKLTETTSTKNSLNNCKTQIFDMKKQIGFEVTLQDFQFIKELGEGKFGVVYLARHIKTNLLFAIKKISKIFEDQNIVQQLIREIKIHSFLDHPNICQLYTFFNSSDFIYLVLELCNSGNIFNTLRTIGKFTEEKVKSIIRQVSYATQYLHEHEIIHRDIKPENIIFHEDVIKLCDFGWSVYAPLSRGTLCGTPIYASPQLVKQTKYNSKIDIWNIGILTYQLLYGRVPFEIRCQADLLKVIQEQIFFPKTVMISDSAKDFIRQCLNKNPIFRISITKILDHEFLNQKNYNRNKNKIEKIRIQMA